MAKKILVLLIIVAFSVFVIHPVIAATIITVGQQADEGILDPNMIISGTGFNILLNVFDTLLHRDKNGELEPALAKEFSPLSDNQWVVKLREDVVFHNGEKFNANSVKYTMERVMDPATGSPQRVYLGAVSKVELVDEFTLHIFTNQPDPTLPLQMLMVPIGPVDYIEEKGADFYGRNPVGTGPFKFVEWTEGERVVIEAFDQHWRGKPNVDKLVFRVIPEMSSLVAALRTREIDIAVNVPPEYADMIDRAPNTRISQAESQRSVAIALPTEKQPYDNKLVRQALNYGVNVEEIVEFIFDGFAVQIPTFHAPMYLGFNEELEPYPHDPEKARELLEEAGYHNGFEGVIWTPSGRYPKDSEVTEAIAGQLREIGVNLEVVVLEWGTMMDMYRAEELTNPFLLGYGTPFWDCGAGFLSRMHSRSFSSYYNNPEVDNLIDQGLSTVDAAEREAIYKRINEIIYDDPSHIFLYQQIDLYGVNERIDWEARSDERVWLFDASIKN